MQSKPAYIVSDIHLGAVPRETERAFRVFLDHVAREAGSLLVNGDLFDFWFEYRSVILREHYRVAAKLADVVEAGVPVSFVGGNHDAWVGSFLRDEIGMRLLEGPTEMDLGGRRALVAHGDGVGRGDYKYRALRRVIRHPASIAAFRSLHPDWGRRIVNLASTTEHKASSGDKASAGRASFIEEWAEERIAAMPEIELVVAGHSHVPALREVRPGRFYVNAGDWIRSYTYVVLPTDGGPPEIRTWGGMRPGE
jgi:UDP-2,3-diacylglucosamine hydrolase